jgi:deoxyribodipyrimidine photolyase-related protein
MISIWIDPDQCSPFNTALAGVDRTAAVVVMVESAERARAMPHHKRKLVLFAAVMRHYADDLRAAGWQVDYHTGAETERSALRAHVARFAPASLRMMEPSDWGRADALRALAAESALAIDYTPHANFISVAADFDRLAKSDGARVTMENFYRVMRRKTGLLMDGAEPAGGSWNYDAENRRKPTPGLHFAPPQAFAPDAITRDVIAMVERDFADHPGIVGDFSLPVTRREALAALEAFATSRLPTFGPWQDAMLAGDRTMSHSLLSAAINVGLLHPLEVCERAELAYRRGDAPLASVEGFIRQILGWREFVWRVYWRQMPDYRTRNALDATLPLPAFFWSGETEMFCLHETLGAVRETAYAHHIQRLMILGNFALIAGLEPVAVNDWFWAMFIDGYDWVMEPNVIGMALHADGGYVGTKPYAASANYISGMSDYCKRCRYDPKQLDGDDACPFNALYWDFIGRNEARFVRNPRMSVIVRSWMGKAPAWQARARRRAADVKATLLGK